MNFLEVHIELSMGLTARYATISIALSGPTRLESSSFKKKKTQCSLRMKDQHKKKRQSEFAACIKKALDTTGTVILKITVSIQTFLVTSNGELLVQVCTM